MAASSQRSVKKRPARTSGNPAKRPVVEAGPITAGDWIGAARLRTLPLRICRRGFFPTAGSTPRPSVRLRGRGIGLGYLPQMSTTIAQNSVDVTHMGAASASINLFCILGGSIGIAIFGSLFKCRHLPSVGT